MPTSASARVCRSITLADDAAEQFLHVDDEVVQIDDARLEELLAAEGKQLARQRGRLLAGFANEVSMLGDHRVVASRAVINSA